MDSHYGKTPTAYSILACITKDDPGSFQNFCDEFGYDDEDKASKKIYSAVLREWINISRLFEDCLEDLREIW